MAIKNYTSIVPANKSIAAIEQLLVSAQASAISKTYDAGQCTGFLFQLQVGPQLLTFQLPVKTEAVYNRFIRSASRLDAKKRKVLRGQAERTAWKTLHEWVHIQVTMIQLEQVEPLQVLLPYVYDPKTGSSFYQKVVGSNLKLLES